MNIRSMCLTLSLIGLAVPATAADGLFVRSAESVWPQWHARIELQMATLSPLNLWLDANAPQRGLKGGAVLGDYYFGSASPGGFRASGGLMVGPLGGAFSGSAAAGSRLGLSLNNVSALSTNNDAVPYLGLGFTGSPGLGGVAITADVGLVAGGSVSRALLGNQGMEVALRELRLSPVLQLGVRYRF